MTIFASRPRARNVALAAGRLRENDQDRSDRVAHCNELRATCDVAFGQQWLHAVTTVTTIQRRYAELTMCIAAFLRTISEVCGSPQTEELLAPHDELIGLLVLPMRQQQVRETQTHRP
jgi:hypothetical protein